MGCRGTVPASPAERLMLHHTQFLEVQNLCHETSVLCGLCARYRSELSEQDRGSCPHGVSILVKATGSKQLRSL